MRRTASLACLALAVLLARSSGLVFGALDIDECDWTVASRVMTSGGVPYVDFVDKKPVLSFLFYAPVALTSFHAWPVQLLAIAWVVATCLLVGRAARAWLGRDEAATVGTWLAFLTAAACRPAVNAETMMNLPAAAALLFFAKATRGRSELRDDLLTGLFVGIAASFKQQAGVLLVSLVVARVWQPGPPLARLRRAASIGAGFAAPWAATALVFAALGCFDAFFRANVLDNLAYGQHSGGSVLERLALGVLLGVVLAAPLPWAFAARETARAVKSEGDPVRRGILLSLWLTFLPVSLGGRFYDHYFIQFAPLVALAAVPGALDLHDRWGSLGTSTKRLLVFGFAVPVAIYAGISFGGGLLGRLPLQEPRARELGAWIKAHTRPEERIFVWGHFSPIYVHAERLPAARHWNASILIGDFDPHHLEDGFDLRPFVNQREVERTLQDLERRRPALFVDTAPADIHDWHRVPLDVVPELQRYRDEHYELCAHPGGAAVYRRRDAPTR